MVVFCSTVILYLALCLPVYGKVNHHVSSQIVGETNRRNHNESQPQITACHVGWLDLEEEDQEDAKRKSRYFGERKCSQSKGVKEYSTKIDFGLRGPNEQPVELVTEGGPWCFSDSEEETF